MHVMASTSRHLVVDGSNIATESRTLPSLAQLDEAVRAAQAEEPGRQITVIVDATFAHRIDPSESKMFEDANNAGEIIMPPAGAVGRGDAFILQVAEKADAAVLSNDSFQEFHGEHPWLFDEGRLIGGKPVEGIGWVFVPRVPVRGPASRRSTREAKDGTSSSGRSSRSGRSGRSTKGRKEARKRTPQGPPPKPTSATPPPGRRERRTGDDGGETDRRRTQRRSRSKGKSTEANDAPSESQPTSSAGARSRSTKSDAEGAEKSKSQKRNVQELNSARDFMLFVTQHSIGDEVSGVVDRFSSHGCYLLASSAQCYLPSSAMGDPPPSRARDVVSLGQTVIVRVESIDSDRRGINVVLVRTVSDDGTKQKPTAGDSRGTNEMSTSQQQASVADETAREANLTRSKTTVATTKPAKKSQKRPAAKKATEKKAAEATTSPRATKAAARRTATKKATKKATAKKTTAKRPAAKKATAKKTTAKKTTAKKTTAKRPAAKKATTKKTTAKKTTAKRPAAKKATTKKTT
ncbi:MAG: hypothetical protein WBM50_18040, partial [Acidimicrobiales bacterium]